MIYNFVKERPWNTNSYLSITDQSTEVNILIYNAAD